MNNLGAMYIDAERFADAEKILCETLEIRRRVLPPDDRQTLNTTENLAEIAGELGRLEEAESMYRDVLNARLRVDGPNNADTLGVMYKLAGLDALRGRRVQALAWLRQAVEHGYRDPVNYPPMSEDPDLEPLRTDPEFQALAARAKREQDLL